MSVHRVDEGDGICFRASVSFEDQRVQPSTWAVWVWSVEVDGDVMRFRDRPGSDGLTVPLANIKRVVIEPRPAREFMSGGPTAPT